MVKLKPWLLNLNPNGRSPLSHAWLNIGAWFLIFVAAAGLMVLISGAAVHTTNDSGESNIIVGIVGIVITIIMLIAIFIGCVDITMMQIRRLHDVNRPAILWILYLLPVVSLIILYWVYIKPGNKFDNAYGPALS